MRAIEGTVTMSISEFKRLESEASEAEKFRRLIENTIETYDEKTGEVLSWDFTKIEKVAEEIKFDL